MCEERKQHLERAERFFKEEGLYEILQELWKADDFKAMVSKSYGLLIEEIEDIQSNVPNHFNDTAVQIWRETEYTVDKYTTDVIDTESVRLYGALLYFKEFLGANELTYKSVINSIRSEGRKKIMAEVEDVCEEILDSIASEYFKMIYSRYLPEDMPEEVASFIKMLSGGSGVMIPITAIFPDFGEDVPNEGENAPKKGSRKVNTAKAKRGTKKK